jgi:hypothetical protein
MVAKWIRRYGEPPQITYLDPVPALQCSAGPVHNLSH